MYRDVLPSTGPTTMTTLIWEAAVARVGEAMNPPNARARVRNESSARLIARVRDARWAPLLVTVDMPFLSAGTQRENAANGVWPPIERPSGGTATIGPDACRGGGGLCSASGPARPGGHLDYARGHGSCTA